MFNLRRAGDLMVLQSDLFPVTLKHAFTTRRLSKPGPGGDRPNFRFDSIESTYKWWVKLRDWLYTPKHLCYCHTQVHGGVVRVLDPDKDVGVPRDVSGFRFTVLGEGDGIIRAFSRTPSFLAITTADCVPMVVYHDESKTVGVVHAGWRSLAADIPANALRVMQHDLGIPPAELLWAIGPCIDVRNYEVGNEVIAALESAGYADSDWRDSEFLDKGWTRSKQRDHYLVNLSVLAAKRLTTLGVRPENIDVSKLSTYGNPNLFYSYRRDGGIQGLQATVIG